MQTLYKFLRTGLTSDYGDHTWEVGKWYEVEGELEKCGNGFHGSSDPLDALSYVKGEILAICEVEGDCVKDTSKQCWRRMRILDARNWTKHDSVALAMFASKLALPKHPTDDRVLMAIERDAAAADAARDAARDAAGPHIAAAAAVRAAASAVRAAWAAASASAAFVAASASVAVKREINGWMKIRFETLEKVA